MEPLNVLMVRSPPLDLVNCQWTKPGLTTHQQVGTGEYTTGWVGSGASGSDKKVGVVGLSLFDLRRRGKVGKLGMVGVNGTKFPAIRM